MSTKTQSEMFQAQHPDPNKQGTRVTKAYYDAYRKALLAVIPTTAVGIPFSSLSEVVQPHVPADILSKTSPGWWTTTVKLDLEARGLVERIEVAGRQNVRQLSS